MNSERIGRLEAALSDAEQSLARDPGSIDLLFEKAQLQALLGEDDAAKHTYLELLHHNSTHFGALTNLAALAMASGHRSAALTAYRQAVEQHPENPIALINLASQLLDENGAAEAVGLCERALRIDPARVDADRVLARALSILGDDKAAEPHWRKAFAGGSVIERPYRGRGRAPRVLLLVSVTSGNIPTQLLLDDRIFAVTAIYAEHFNLDMPLPEHDVVFNAIGDADLCSGGLRAAESIISQSCAPIVNHPMAVATTGRVENARRLGHLQGVSAPKIEAIAKSVLLSEKGHIELKKLGFAFPLLLRAPGFHTGRHFVRVEHEDDLAGAVEQLPGEKLLAMQYLDARGSDGLARKYRVMMIGDTLYPVHLAASKDWKVHYFTSDMAKDTRLRKEEERFLTAMPEVLGTRGMRSLELIRECLALDYAGVDFALSQAGDLSLFEANATMTILPPDSNPIWNYRRPAIARVLAAARQLIVDKAAIG